MKKIFSIVCGLLLMAGAMQAKTDVVAHRGYWNCEGAAMNTLASMRDAYKAGVAGSEFDVHITTDGVVVVNHDDDIHGVIIEEAKYAQIKNMKLANGETLPTLRQYLAEGKKLGNMRLVLEVKAHQTPEREDRCVAEAVKEVKEAGLQSRVDYISFSMHACEQIHKVDPKAPVYYLGSDVAPEAIKAKGFAGIDYYSGAFDKNPGWISESHKLGMKVNVWTVDDVKEIQKFVKAGVDYITTNKPVEAKKISEGKLKY